MAAIIHRPDSERPPVPADHLVGRTEDDAARRQLNRPDVQPLAGFRWKLGSKGSEFKPAGGATIEVSDRIDAAYPDPGLCVNGKIGEEGPFAKRGRIPLRAVVSQQDVAGEIDDTIAILVGGFDRGVGPVVARYETLKQGLAFVRVAPSAGCRDGSRCGQNQTGQQPGNPAHAPGAHR